MNVESQTIKSAYLYTDVCYLDEKTNLKTLINSIELYQFLIIMVFQFNSKKFC